MTIKKNKKAENVRQCGVECFMPGTEEEKFFQINLDINKNKH
ncbi:hypothetical protein [Streptococcus parauberis]